MSGLREYLGGVVAVCLLAALAMATVQQDRIRSVVRLISGLLVVLVVLRPLPSLDWSELTDRFLSLAGGEFDSEGVQQEYQKRLRENIQETTQRFIEEKAQELGAFVRAKVELTDEEYPVPAAARLIGIVNQNQFLELSRYMSESLGIPAERQEWTMNETG